MSGIDLGAIDKAIDTITVKIEETTVLAQRKIILAVDQAVVLATPVDEGRARSNWITSLGKPSEQIINKESFDKSGGSAIQQCSEISQKIKFGDDVFISNNLPYIGRLNDGYSKQAPAGYVQKAVQAAKGAIEG